MLPGLPRMMLYLDLIRRGSKTFVTLQVTCPQVVLCGALMWCPDVVGLLGYCKGRAGYRHTRCGVEVERLDHDSAVLPLFLSVSLRKQLPSSEPEFGKVRHGHGDVARRELEKALSLAYLQSLQRHEAVMMDPGDEITGLCLFGEIVWSQFWQNLQCFSGQVDSRSCPFGVLAYTS